MHGWCRGWRVARLASGGDGGWETGPRHAIRQGPRQWGLRNCSPVELKNSECTSDLMSWDKLIYGRYLKGRYSQSHKIADGGCWQVESRQLVIRLH